MPEKDPSRRRVAGALLSSLVTLGLLCGGCKSKSGSGGKAVSDPDKGFEPIAASETIIFSFGTEWLYHDLNMDLGATWKDPGFDASGWKIGIAEFGFGDRDESTLIANPDENAPSTYFRKDFDLVHAPQGGTLNLKFDDGAAVWVNGQLVGEFDCEAGTEFAKFATGDDATNRKTVKFNSRNPFVVGKNTIAVMVKNIDQESSDLSFAARLALDIGLQTPGLDLDLGG